MWHNINGRAFDLRNMVERVVVHAATLEPVPQDGKTVGESLIRGNTVMKGCLKRPSVTACAFEGGWFHTGDLAVAHIDGCVQVLGRAWGTIIGASEIAFASDIEDVLRSAPSILQAVVAAQPDDVSGGVSACIQLSVAATDLLTESEVLPRPHPPLEFTTQGVFVSDLLDSDGKQGPDVCARRRKAISTLVKGYPHG